MTGSRHDRRCADVPVSLVLRGGSLVDGRRVDLLVRDGRIDTVVPAGTPLTPTAQMPDGAPGHMPDGAPGHMPYGAPDHMSDGAPDHMPDGAPGPVETVDLSGYLLLPAPSEPHAHLDKAYTADIVSNPSGDLDGAVDAWLRHRPSLRATVEARSHAAVRAYVGHGATAIRTHVDLGGDLGLSVLESVLAVREAVTGLCDVQVVAFASPPLSGAAGASGRALLREAMSAGADIVGACPARDPDPAGCIDACLAIASECGATMDLHVDEGLDVDVCTLALLADAVTQTDFPYGVVASHCVSLGMLAPEPARRIAERVAAAGIAVVCLPQTNLYLQGRGYASAAPRGLTALRILRAAGVTVAAGGDNLQDPFNCLGRADPLETAALLVLAGHDTPENAYMAVSAAARQALKLSTVDIRAGVPAEILAIRAGSVREAVAESSPDRVVVHAGRVVARTTVTRHVQAPASGAASDISTYPVTSR
jgi:cytosine/creatinine deaminase